MRRPSLLATALLSILLTGCAGGSDTSVAGGYTAGAAARPASAGSACGTAHRAAYRHVIWIWMENRSYNAVLGKSTDAPRLRKYANACGLATNYHGITHPSLPNYLAAVAGSTGGVTTDCDPSACPQRRSSLFGQVSNHGMSWRGYAESMDHRCDRGSHGRYAARHNPAVYFRPIRDECRTKDVVMGGASGRFAHALAAPKLPRFAFVTPNLCHDGHDCSTSVADSWLGTWLDRITASPAYAAGDTVVFVTWDEGVGSNHIATVVIAPTVPSGTTVDHRYNHFSLLRTTEELLGLPLLRHAADAASMAKAFSLA
jgi:hypothetical protein